VLIMSYCRKTPYEKKYSRKNKEQEEWILERTALDSSAEQVDDINKILEQFEAKSEEGRRCALTNLIRTTRNRTCEEAHLEDNKKLLLQYLVQCMHGTPSVALLAFDALEVLALIFGTDDDFAGGLLKAVSDIAVTVGASSLEPEQQEVVGAAARTLGSVCFFCCDNDDTIRSVIESLDKIISTEPKNSSQPVVAGALSAWELMHTITDFSTEYHVRMTSAIWAHLNYSKCSVETRIAAARALGFLFSLFADEGDTVTKHRKWLPNVDGLTDIINECAFGKTHPKADRAKEQPIFKTLASWMIDGEDLPADTITLNGTKVVFETWIILARLATVRRIVGPGLQGHLLSNDVIAEALQFEVPEPPKKGDRKRMTEADKRYARYKANQAERAKSARKFRPSPGGGDYDDDDDDDDQ